MGGGGVPPSWTLETQAVTRIEHFSPLWRSLLSLLCSFLSSLLSFLVSRTILTSFSRPWDPKNLANPMRGSSNLSFSVFWQWHAPRTQKIIQKPSPWSPKAPKTSPQRDPGAPKGDPRAPKERPQSVPIGPSGLQEASGIAVGRLRTSFWTFRTSLFHTFRTPQRPSNVCQSCVLCSLFSPLFSLHPGFWDLTRGLRTSTLGPNA